MNKLTLTLSAALIACVMFAGVTQSVEAAGGRGGGGRGGGGFRGGVGRGFHAGPVIKGQALSVPGGVRNLRGPVKGQALSVPGGVRNIGFERRRRDGLFLGAGVGSGYGGYGFGGGFAPWLYESGHIPTPPYFALHPPVYYSHPVPRSYGYSPFAYPGSVRTPEVVEITPEVITNPYVEQPNVEETEDAKEEDDAVSKMTPQVILNPFVDLNRGSDELHVVKTTEHSGRQEDSNEDLDVSADDTTEVAPQEILNPYVKQESEA